MKLAEWKSRDQQQEINKNDQQLDGDEKNGLWQEIQVKRDPFHDVGCPDRWKCLQFQCRKQNFENSSSWSNCWFIICMVHWIFSAIVTRPNFELHHVMQFLAKKKKRQTKTKKTSYHSAVVSKYNVILCTYNKITRRETFKNLYGENFETCF